MNKTTIRICCAVLFCLGVVAISCGRNMNGAELKGRAKMIAMKDSTCSESLLFWTADTIKKTDLELVMLLDTLYQYALNDSISKTVREEVQWMDHYRQRLCALYETRRLGCDTISMFAKADTVLNVAERLYEIDDDWSTMGILVYNSICSTFDTFREYNALSQLLANCKDEETKELVYQEWTLYEELLGHVAPITGNIVDLTFWGGSIVGPLTSDCIRQLSDARSEMYMKLSQFVNGDDFEDEYGVFLDCAGELLFNCIGKAIDKEVKSTLDFQREFNEMSKESLRLFMETADEAKSMASEMRPLMRQWTELWDKLDEKLTHNWSRHSTERIASLMLLKWASVVCSI